MKLDDIRKLARERGLKPARLTKRELIKLIQRSEGNFDCYASADQGHCDQLDCLWIDPCLKEAVVPVAAVKSAPKKRAATKKKSSAKKKAVTKKEVVAKPSAPKKKSVAGKVVVKKKVATKKKVAEKKGK